MFIVSDYLVAVLALLGWMCSMVSPVVIHVEGRAGEFIHVTDRSHDDESSMLFRAHCRDSSAHSLSSET